MPAPDERREPDNAAPPAGFVALRSPHRVPETVERLVAHASDIGLTVFARIDHAAGAAAAGLPLRPTQLIVVGNARGGTPLMQQRQTIGIDLPLKLLTWEDESGQVWVAYDDPEWIVERHGLGASAEAIGATLKRTLDGLARSAVE